MFDNRLDAEELALVADLVEIYRDGQDWSHAEYTSIQTILGKLDSQLIEVE